MMDLAAFVQTTGPLDVHQAAQFLLAHGYIHDPEWREGRYRSFKHPDNPKVLTFREWPDGGIMRKQADRIRQHVARTFALNGGENDEKPVAE